MSTETSGLKWELELERAAHRETQAHLQRALRAGMAWKMEVEALRSGEPTAGARPPNPLLATRAAPDPATCAAPNPGGGDGGGADADAGDGGGDVVELLLATIGCLGQMAELTIPGDPLGEEQARLELVRLARFRLSRLERALAPAEGAARRGGATGQGGEGQGA